MSMPCTGMSPSPRKRQSGSSWSRASTSSTAKPCRWVSCRACSTTTPIPPESCRSLTTKATLTGSRAGPWSADGRAPPQAHQGVAPFAGTALRPADAVLVDPQVRLACALPAALLRRVGLGDRRSGRELAGARAERRDEVRRYGVLAGGELARRGRRRAVEHDRRPLERHLAG